MSDEPKEPDDQLQRLLRQWGVEEASRQSHPPQAPGLNAAPARHEVAREPAGVSGVRRWWPLAAGLILFAGAAALVAVSQFGASKASRGQPTQAAGQDGGELKTAKEELAKSQAALAEAEKKLAVAEPLAAQLDGVTRQLESARATLATERKDAQTASERQAAEITDLQTQLAKKQTDLENLSKLVDKSESEIAGLKSDLAAALKDQGAIRAKLEAEVAALRKATEDALAAADRRLAALAAERGATLRLLKEQYFARSAAGGFNLLASRTAAQEHELLGRYGRMRGSIQSPDVRKLGDTIEVLLTRLNLLSLPDPEQEKSFLDLVRQDDLAARVQNVIASGQEPAEVQTWLLESLLVLTEVN